MIGAGTTVSVLTVGSAQTCYVKSILLYNHSSTSVNNVKVHFVENAGGSAGVANSENLLARIGLQADDTFFFEPAYPITLTSNGDTIQVYNEGTVAANTNVLVLGDKEV